MEPGAQAALVFVDGRLVAPRKARISPFDHGFLYGESVFETVRTEQGSPLFLDRHLERLRRSAGCLALPMPEALPDMRALGRQAFHRLRDEVTLRIVVTRGAGPVGVDASRVGPSRAIVLASRLVRRPALQYERGVSARIASVRKVPSASIPAEAKTGNFVAHLLAAREARGAGADEALLQSARDELVEGATSNLFWVKRGVLFTPALETGCLPGITREIVLGIAARKGIEAREVVERAPVLRDADEVFLTNSTGSVIPVRSVDGARVGNGRPGPITTRLALGYDEEVVLEGIRAQ